MQNERENIDSSFRSSGGQASGNRKQPFEKNPIGWSNITNAVRTQIKVYTDYVQTSIPHFVDKYPDAHSDEPPFYGIIESKNIPLGKRDSSNFTYNASITYRECR